MGHSPLIDPGSIHHMTAVNEVGGKLGLFHTDGQHIGRANRFTHISLSYYTGSQSGTGGISAADHDLRVGGETHCQQNRVDQCSDYIRRTMQRGEFFHINTDLFTDLFRPDSPSSRFIEQGIGCIGMVDSKIPAQHVSHQGIHMTKTIGTFINIRQVPFDPKHRCAGHSTGHRAIGRDFKQPCVPIFSRKISASSVLRRSE